ncbi:MAG TPA: glycosyltransferase family 39 protein [Stellaceae bacterium]|jgi:4-amino-4-deoxy-L-arabinose transferase-like glycosyltransferase|nr:glycosyltransferase family 39 protein [Stellaceae bacterium]
MNETRARPAPTQLHAATAILAAIGLLSALRLALIAAEPVGLYPDEAQYWFWAQHLALGYYSKPPLVAWTIALTTAIFGDGEFGVRAAAPLLHAGTALLIYTMAARLYDRRVGFWAALAYASLPGTSLSSFIISTDAVLLPCWAAALYAFIRAREAGGGKWWIVVGIAAGLGLLAKYAMAYWIVSAFLYVLALRVERRHLRGLIAATALAILIYLPNLWWNWHNGFVSYLHLRDNANIAGPLFHPKMLAEFLLSQFGVFGPVLFAFLIAVALRPRALAEPRARLMAVFTFPTLVFMLAVSLISRAQPNWAAPVYVSASVLVAAWALGRDWRRGLAGAIALNLILAAGIFALSDTAAPLGLPAWADPLHRLRGWHKLGDAVAAALAAHPGLTLLADDRELIAALIYNVRPHPFDAVIWSPLPGIKDQWALTNNLANHVGGDFLAVTAHNLADRMRPLFAEFTPAGEITISPGPGGSRTYHLYIARGYKGG